MKLVTKFCIVKLYFILSLVTNGNDIKETKFDNKEILVFGVNFSDQKPLSIEKLKSEIINHGFDWSTVMAYAVTEHRILFISELKKPVFGVKHGAFDLQLILSHICGKHSYTFEYFGVLNSVNVDSDVLIKNPDP